MAPPLECEWRWEINVHASFLSLPLSPSLLFIHISFSEHTTPAVSLPHQAYTQWDGLYVNMIALFVFPDV